jgi:hypothetical protein
MESYIERKERLKKEAEESKLTKELRRNLKRKVRSDITDSGLNSVRYKLDFIRENPNSKITFLPHSVVVECYEEAIKQFLKTKE